MKAKLRKILATPLYKKAYSRAFFTLYGLVWKEVCLAFSQFFTWKHPFRSLWHVFAVIFSSKIRLLLGRSVKYSFAFTGEDRILESLYRPLVSHNGFYVDVGCNHPKFLSNTYTFYRRGWRGVCVDANQMLIKKFAYLRPRDTAVCALVSNDVSSRSFYLAENNVLSTTEQTNLQGEDMRGIKTKKVEMIPQTLTSILEEANTPTTFDLLSVDTEEHDLQVIQSLDFSRYTPKLIIAEDELFNIKNPSDNKLVQHLEKQGYTLSGYLLKNLYFELNK